MSDCPHNALRRMRHAKLTFNGYVCGNCSKVFEVKEHVEPEPPKPKPLSDQRPPWGLRDRQA